MSAKGYFSNLQNRHSANFIAMTSCISLVYAIVFHTIDYLPRHLKWGYNLYGWDFPFAYWLISTAILGFIVLFVIFPLSIHFCLLLKSCLHLLGVLVYLSTMKKSYAVVHYSIFLYH